MNARGLLGTLALVALVAASWLLARSGNPNDEPQTRTGAVPNPGYYLRDGQMIGLDDAGGRLYELSAALIEQQPDTNTVLLQELQLDYTADTELPWRMLADYGEIPNGGEVIVLRGNVHLRRLQAGGSGSTLTTDSLEVAPRAKRASTDAAVTLQDAGNTLRATGMVADLAAGNLRLSANVRGTFRP